MDWFIFWGSYVAVFAMGWLGRKIFDRQTDCLHVTFPELDDGVMTGIWMAACLRHSNELRPMSPEASANLTLMAALMGKRRNDEAGA